MMTIASLPLDQTCSMFRLYTQSKIILFIVLGLFISSPSQAQVSSLVVQDGDIGDPVPSSVYIGDARSLVIIQGECGSSQPKSITWTMTATAPSGVTATATPQQATNFFLQLYSLGKVTLKADFVYNFDSAGYKAPDNSITVEITVTPPTGITFIDANSPAPHSPAPNAAYDFATLDFFYFHIVGGDYNNGYNMTIEEKITTTVPAGVPPSFGGGWGWATGDPNNPNDAPDLVNYTSGLVSDKKGYSGNGLVNGAVVANGGILYQYTQILGVKVANMDNTMTDITLGTFTVTHYRVGTIQYRTTVK